MFRLLPVVTCVLLLCAARVEAACEREWAAMGPGFARERMDFFDERLLFYAGRNSNWHEDIHLNGSQKPADTRAALRLIATIYGRLDSSYPRQLYQGCRSRYLADQMDAADNARRQQDLNNAAQLERDRQAREQQARNAQAQRNAQAARDAQAVRDRQSAERERNLRNQLDAERAQRQALEAELRRQREEARLAAEEEARRAAEEEDKRIAAEEAAYQRQLRADNERRRKEEEERKRRDEEEKPFPGRNVSECIRLMKNDEAGSYGGFINTCDFPIYFAYCAYRPKQNEFEAKFECDANSGGLNHIAAKGRQAAFTKQAERIFWFACNAPSTPNVRFQPGTGLSGTCR